jgi:hypothetical protein
MTTKCNQELLLRLRLGDRSATPLIVNRTGSHKVFVLTMLTAAFTELFVRMSSRMNFAADLAAGIVAVSGMVAMTLLLHAILKGRGHHRAIWRILLPADRLPHFQVDLSPTNSPAR